MVMTKYQLDVLIFFDYETYFKTRASSGNKSFTLKNNTYWNYIFDERFHLTGLGFVADLDSGIAYASNEQCWKGFHRGIKKLREQGKRVGIVAHNAQFDCSIASWVFGTQFDFYFDTKAMATLLDPHLSSSLKSVAKRLWPEREEMQKGGVELQSVDGIKYEYITEEQHKALGHYCKQDVNLCREIFFEQFAKIHGQGLLLEVDAINLTIRGCVEPQFAIERGLLHEVVEESEQAKSEVLKTAIAWCWSKGLEKFSFKDSKGVKTTETVSSKAFSSNVRYAGLLESLGVEIPYKMSPTTHKRTPALGKNDPEYVKTMLANADLQHIFAARELSMSNIAKTRAETMLKVANLFDGAGFHDADMPFFLNYYGAGQTGRFSGGQKLNQQNNTRGGKHRLSMLAPDNHFISVCDLSNIELRVNLWLCGQNDLLDEFRKDPKFDLYKIMAMKIFNVDFNQVEKLQRQMGKAASLGLGFSMGWFGFQQYLASGPLGMAPMFETDSFCKNVKNAYETKHFMIKEMWSFIDSIVIPAVVRGGDVKFGPDKSFIARKNEIQLPSGRVLRYPNAQYQTFENYQGIQTCTVFDDYQKKDRFGNCGKKNLWRGLVLENIVQAAARDLLVWQMVNIERELQARKLGWVMGSVHDEVLASVKEECAQEAYDLMATEMKKAPDWCKGIPLFNEGGFAKEYSK